MTLPPSASPSPRRLWLSLVLGLGGGFLLGIGLPLAAEQTLSNRPGSAPLEPCDASSAPALPPQIAQAAQPTDFLVMAGGGAPSYNEIALEKNVLYFQRTLAAMGFDSAAAQLFFANGNDGRATVRYLNEQRQIQFKPPEIPNLQGASTLANLRSWVQQRASANAPAQPRFFYFTGHGTRNAQNLNNNYLMLWGDQPVSVQQLAGLFDQLPSDEPLVTMMAQCYSGSFANVMYAGGRPDLGLAPQNRCGFFATVRTLPSVGCTPEVNEADYEDYSSSFFAGLSGISRTGERVASADYNQDGTIAYAEAHAFAKVDEETTDLPVSTLEVWLQDQATLAVQARILEQPMGAIATTARPEQRYVIESLAQQFDLDLTQSYTANRQRLQSTQALGTIPLTYLERLRMELINVGMEAEVRQGGESGAIALIDRLINCESGSWQ